MSKFEELQHAKNTVNGGMRHSKKGLTDLHNLERRISRHSDELRHLKTLFVSSSAPAQRIDWCPVTRHADPLTGRCANPADAKTEEVVDRAEILADVVQSMRRECELLTVNLRDTFPPETFADFFDNDRAGSGARLPPPPALDAMLSRYQAEEDRRSAAAAERSARAAVDSVVESVRLSAQLAAQHHAEFLVAPPPMTARAEQQLNPIEVVGLVPPGRAVDADRVSNYVSEVHALQLLSYVMHAAAEIEQNRMCDQPASRGSSETPSITPITSVLDQSVAPGHSRAVVADHHGRTNGVLLMAQEKVSGSVVAPCSASTAAGGERQHDAVSTTSMMSPPPRGSRSIQFLGDALSAPNKTSHVMTSVSAITQQTETSTSDTASNIAGSTEMQVGSSTVHDTSTAATGGSSPSAASIAGTAGGGSRPTATRSVLSNDVAQGRQSASQPGTDSSQNSSRHTTTSSSSKQRKKQRGLFACIRRDDDSDREE